MKGDRELALEFLKPGMWTVERVAALGELVARNELVGSALGYDGYVCMRDLLWAAQGLLHMEKWVRDELRERGWLDGIEEEESKEWDGGGSEGAPGALRGSASESGRSPTDPRDPDADDGSVPRRDVGKTA